MPDAMGVADLVVPAVWQKERHVVELFSLID